MIIPETEYLTIYQGATFKKKVMVQEKSIPIDLTGATVRMQLRSTVASETILIELNEANSRAVVSDPLMGEVTLLIADEDTQTLNFTSAVYDLEVEYADGTVDRVLQGKVKLIPEVTRTL